MPIVNTICSCGCGQKIIRYVWKAYLKKYGNKRYMKGHHPLNIAMEKNPRWKGGRIIDKNGYIYIKAPSNPMANYQGYVFEHRLIMSKHIGRPLKSKEVVHHINHIKNDNRIENLELNSCHSKHISKCRMGRKFPRKKH